LHFFESAGIDQEAEKTRQLLPASEAT